MSHPPTNTYAPATTPRRRSRLATLVRLVVPDLPESDAPVALAPTVAIPLIVRRFLPFLRPYLPWFLVGLVFIGLAQLVATVEIWLFQVVVDEVLVPRDLAPFIWLAAAFIGLTVLSGALSFLDDVIAARVAGGFLLSLRSHLYGHLLRLSPDQLEGRRLGDVLTRLTGDIGAIETLIVGGTGTAVAAVVKIALFVGALLLIDVQLTVMSLVVAPLFWLAARRFAARIKNIAREKRRRSGALTSVAEEALSNAALVQASNRQDDEEARFRREGQAIMDASIASTKIRSLFAPVVDLVELSGALVVMALGTAALAEGRLSLGELLVFLTFLTRLYGPVRDLASLSNTIYSASAGAERILELIDQASAVSEAPDARDIGRGQGDLVIDRVSYRYPGADHPALRAVSLRLTPGKVVAVVGPNGAGKSTLVKLLLRFADPTSGIIWLDGGDIRELTLSSLRRSVGALFQEAHVFDASAEENIRYGRPDATPEQVVAAARAADADDFLSALPEGYATRLTQRGRRLSGGQRQRIGIARLFLRDTPVVIFDEPSASLDATTAMRIREPLRRLMEGRATLVISHELLWVREADEIVVMDEGRVVEQGGHEELLALGGLYARLWAEAQGRRTTVEALRGGPVPVAAQP